MIDDDSHSHSEKDDPDLMYHEKDDETGREETTYE